MVHTRLFSFRVLFLGGLFLLSVLIPTLAPASVQAQEAPKIVVDAKFVDRATIEVVSIKINDDVVLRSELKRFGKDKVSEWLTSQVKGNYKDPDMSDNETRFSKDSCHSEGAKNTIAASSLEGVEKGEFHIDINFMFVNVEDPGSALGCEQAFVPANTDFLVNDVGNNKVWFYFNEDNSQVLRADNNSEFWGIWTPREDNDRIYVPERGHTCGSDKAYVELKDAPGESTSADFESCHNVGKVSNILVKGNGSNPNPQTPGTAADERPTCETSGGLTWIICPVINGMAILADGIFNQFIRPLLHTKPVDTTNPNNPTFQVWVAMRNIANILLVIAMIIIVFGQAIGGGLVDAYTAKKVLPRILAAAIMINLSIYMAALAIDVTNIIGNSIANLIYLPFKQAGEFQINITQGTGAIGTAGIAGLFAAGVIWSGAFGAVIGWLALFILLPLVLAFLGALFTIVVRMGLIQFLVITAPIACVLYCLPNTEKYFKKWWDLFLKTLLVYPIVMVIFALADVMAVAIDMSGNELGGVSEQAGDFVKIVLLALPLFLIPYAFKMAGGAIGAVHGAITDRGKKGIEAIKGNPNDQRSLGNRVRYGARSNINTSRQNAVARLSRGGKSDSRIVRGLSRAASPFVNYGNLEAERASMNDEIEKIVAAQYSNGGDDSVRALWAQQYKGTAAEGPANGRKVGHWYSPYKNADGTPLKEWSVVDVKKARSLVGKDPSKLQAYAKYEFGKAVDDGRQEQFEERLGQLMGKDEFNYSGDVANGVWGGVKFTHQGSRKERKHTTMERQADGSYALSGVNQQELSTELAEAVSKGQFAGFRASTGIAAEKGFIEAHDRLNGSGADYNLTDKKGKPVYSRAEDQKVIDNYQKVAANLEPSFTAFGVSGAAQQAQQAAQAANAAAASDHDADVANIGGYGLGGTATGDAAWRSFVNTVNSRTPGPATTPRPPIPPTMPGGGFS